MLKKFSLALMMSALVVSLAACGGSSSSSAGKPTGSDGYDMTYIVTDDSGYLNFLWHDAVEAADSLGINLDVKYAGEDSNRVTDCIAQARAQKKDAVILNVVNSEDAEGCLEVAGDMKVVFINRIPADISILSENAAAVCSDEKLSGGFQGDFLVKTFNDKGMKEVRYLFLQGTPGLIHTDLRSSVPFEKLEAAGIKMTPAAETILGDYKRSTAQTLMNDLLEGPAGKNLKFDCIISNNDEMAIGAITSLKDHGYDPAKYTIVGIDGLPDALAAIEKGEMAMSVYQNSKGQANGAICAAKNMIDGKAITDGTDYVTSEESEYVIYVPFEEITAANLNDYK